MPEHQRPARRILSNPHLALAQVKELLTKLHPSA
jgi:hypothetical protein